MSTPRVMSLFSLGPAASPQPAAETDITVSAKIALRNGTIVLLVATGYYVATKIGFAFTPAGRPISTFWPPNALLLATMLLAPRRVWWILLLAALPAHLMVQLAVVSCARQGPVKYEDEQMARRAKRTARIQCLQRWKSASPATLRTQARH